MLKEVSRITVENSRKIADALFVLKALYDFIMCQDIINKFNLNVPPENFRHSELLRTERHRTLYGYFSYLNRPTLHVNSFASSVYPFSFSSCIAKRLQQMLSA